jgi:hypothetical protein
VVSELTLPQLLELPLKHVSKYESFLETINMKTPSTDPDHQWVVDAYVSVSSLAEKVIKAREHATYVSGGWLRCGGVWCLVSAYVYVSRPPTMARLSVHSLM